MKKVLLSLLTIGIVGTMGYAATRAFFSDVETSKNNTLSAGIVDIVVDGENPWSTAEEFKLEDMKPSYTKYIEFTVRNLEESNEINLWKHINITNQSDGVITEPECDEGGGAWLDGDCNGNYISRNNLAAYTLYDLYVCEDPVLDGKCKTDDIHKPVDLNDWKAIIKESQYVRLDNISSVWIHLGQLVPAKELKVVQSYHLSSWPDAPEPEVTNWAQGDIMTFDIELMATQLNAPGPKGVMATLNMDNKNPVTWEPMTDGIGGTLTYNTSGSTFDYALTATGLALSTSYSLIYYADPYPGNNPGALIGTHMTDGGGNINVSGQSVNLNKDLPSVGDANYPGGAKIWLVPSTRYNSPTNSIIGWNPTEYLFEINLITYDDTDI